VLSSWSSVDGDSVRSMISVGLVVVVAIEDPDLSMM
jgi:hypothetical protein